MDTEPNKSATEPTSEPAQNPQAATEPSTPIDAVAAAEHVTAIVKQLLEERDRAQMERQVFWCELLRITEALRTSPEMGKVLTEIRTLQYDRNILAKYAAGLELDAFEQKRLNILGDALVHTQDERATDDAVRPYADNTACTDNTALS